MAAWPEPTYKKVLEWKENNVALGGHSAYGITSFGMSIATAVLIVFISLILGVIGASSPQGISQESTTVGILGLGLWASWLASFVAFGFGIRGIVKKEQNEIFAVLGTIFSIVIAGGMTLLILLGSVMR